ncbi:MAG: response regulator [Prevotella sp.]|nr:response regulator [Prevotella sp.]MEE1317713.1 response regulator [Prevotella sp.]
MSEKDFSNYTILVVDDVPLNLVLVEKMLGRYNFNIKKAGGGQQALNMIAEEAPSVVLLDLMMPNIDGYEVLRRLRSDASTKNLPVIILSALNSDADIIKGFKAGANDFITKPIIMDRLIGSILKQLQIEE